MTIIEKIKTEIERLKGQLIRGACAAQIEMETNCKEEAYDEVLDFLSTLESEKPINQEGLDGEIDRLWESFADEMEGPHNLFDIYARLARHFAQWGAEHAREQMLKEAVEGKIGEVGFHNAVYLQEPKWTNFLDGFKKGDKVRVIVLPKEDEK